MTETRSGACRRSRVSRRYLVLTAVGTALLLAMPGAAAATEKGSGQTVRNHASVEVQKSNRSVGKLAFVVHRTSAPSVTAINAADARTSNCSGCRSAGVAFEVVLASRGPATLIANNEATAVNADCTRCEAVAEAYQFVIESGDVLTITSAGQQQLDTALTQLEQVLDVLPPADELDARVAAVAEQVTNTLMSEVQPGRGHVNMRLQKRVQHKALA